MKNFEQYFKFCKKENIKPSHADSLIKFFGKGNSYEKIF